MSDNDAPDRDSGERQATLPTESSRGSNAQSQKKKTAAGTVLIDKPATKPTAKVPPTGTLLIDPTDATSATPKRGSSPTQTDNGTVMMEGSRSSVTPRPSAIARPSRTTRDPSRRSRTTIMEVGEMAQRLSLLPRATRPGEATLGMQVVLSFGISITLALLGTMIFAGGAWRMVLGILAATVGTALAILGTLRSLPRLAKRLGPRELPGPAAMWVTGFVFIAAAAVVGFTYTVSQATKQLASGGAELEKRKASSADEVEPPPTPTESGPADASIERGSQVRVTDGVLYVPKKFHSENGRFDLLMHYHGNVELVEQSVDATEINALIYIVNYGEFSGRYIQPLRNPRAFDDMLTKVEQAAADKLGLVNARINRVALSSWSAGYGALYHILSSRSRLDRIDAVLMEDSLHASFAPGSDTKIAPLSIKPFLQYAKRAVQGETLFVITHSAVQTADYPDTTRSADGLLEALGIERATVDPAKGSPPAVTIDSAVKAFPSRDKEWLQINSEAHRGGFHVLGSQGDGKGAHIAHLAQISVTVLPLLKERWEKKE